MVIIMSDKSKYTFSTLFDPVLEYAHIDPFYEGLAMVKQRFLKKSNNLTDDKIGFIDKTGKIVIPIEYDAASRFSEGLAPIKKNGKTGFIDKTGNVIIPLEYNNAQCFSEGLSAVKKDGKRGFIDKSGTIIIPFEYDWAHPFRNGLSSVVKNGKWGVIDKTGRTVIPLELEYDYTDNFYDGLARVFTGRVPLSSRNDDFFYSFISHIERTPGKEEKHGFIDKTGKIVIPLEYEGSRAFSEGYAFVIKNDKRSFIDTAGKESFRAEYDIAGDFHEGLAAVKKDGKWGYIDKTGKAVIPIEYDFDDCVYPFNEDFASIKIFGKCGYIDKEGKAAAPIEYDFAHNVHEGLAVVQKDGKWGILEVKKEN